MMDIVKSVTQNNFYFFNKTLKNLKQLTFG
jgi:hypothetical protein